MSHKDSKQLVIFSEFVPLFRPSGEIKLGGAATHLKLSAMVIAKAYPDYTRADPNQTVSGGEEQKGTGFKWLVC